MSALEAKNTTASAIQDVRSSGNTRKEGVGLLEANQRETSQYIADMVLELRNMAKAAKLHKVMVPLEFAYYEAFGVANRVEIPKEEIDRLNELARNAQAYEADSA